MGTVDAILIGNFLKTLPNALGLTDYQYDPFQPKASDVAVRLVQEKNTGMPILVIGHSSWFEGPAKAIYKQVMQDLTWAGLTYQHGESNKFIQHWNLSFEEIGLISNDLIVTSRLAEVADLQKVTVKLQQLAETRMRVGNILQSLAETDGVEFAYHVTPLAPEGAWVAKFKDVESTDKALEKLLHAVPVFNGNQGRQALVRASQLLRHVNLLEDQLAGTHTTAQLRDLNIAASLLNIQEGIASSLQRVLPGVTCEVALDTGMITLNAAHDTFPAVQSFFLTLGIQQGLAASNLGKNQPFLQGIIRAGLLYERLDALTAAVRFASQQMQISGVSLELIPGDITLPNLWPNLQLGYPLLIERQEGMVERIHFRQSDYFTSKESCYYFATVLNRLTEYEAVASQVFDSHDLLTVNRRDGARFSEDEIKLLSEYASIFDLDKTMVTKQQQEHMREVEHKLLVYGYQKGST